MKKFKRLLSMFLCCAMMLSSMSVTAFAEDGNGRGGSKLNYIDVRVDGSLTLESKVNGEVQLRETIDVTVSNVSGILNGKSVTF